MMILRAFLTGGALCLPGQLLIDKTKLTPARILVGYVAAGVLFGALGLYDRLTAFAGAGASVPLSGFGNLLAEGIRKGVQEQGVLGLLSGGLTSAAAGITAAMLFALLSALCFEPKDK